ncbi:MAG: site-specific integrase, partial [Pseudolabrys sp.]
QDPREVKTKNSKPQITTFFPVAGEARRIVTEWVELLTKDRLWGLDDPLFPATLVEHGTDRQFKAGGLARRHWSNADAIRTIFKEAFETAGLPGFNPHSFRHALAMLGERTCSTPEEFKAWSQNLGHEQVLTTLTSYGEVAPYRQAEIMRTLAARPAGTADRKELARRFMELAVAAGLSESDRSL